MPQTNLITQIHTPHKAVAFTFDDGPHPTYTPMLLDIFREAQGKATFYMIGEQIEQFPELATAVYEQGHEIGNHTYSHPFLTELSDEACREELIRAEKLIEAITGTIPATFRPPYFNIDERVTAIAAELGYVKIAGAANGEARDWEQPGVQHIVDATRESLSSGSLLIFHDGYGDRSQTIEAVRILVSELTAEGYKLVTVSELIALADEAETSGR
ncbi:polysaccharide deacetylase family protein [Paenibacillus sp. NEAU-GSW1]|uniref:polysaccharide deacetylase family protein n=1 Tax=Paenibacillus sp. NEAU-GSW1 TaxID=2682486 RepID=UPI0012E27600|nr:polysaccharide deacetylase family protein [Paenibacillus sp. NEAU-GSW1]MUT65709.1 polysaccharide deacetylase family protein [Paenibacillus sp. NEAU-GSW1]